MEGLYATLDALKNKMHLCHFPFGTLACHAELARLRRIDPPVITDIVPPNPIGTIAPHNLLDAYHFLMRAASAIISDNLNYATPYLMAFSTLAAVRFACIELMADQTGINIKMTVIDENNLSLSQGRRAITAMLRPITTRH
jgi:hypothetical protein